MNLNITSCRRPGREAAIERLRSDAIRNRLYSHVYQNYSKQMRDFMDALKVNDPELHNQLICNSSRIDLTAGLRYGTLPAIIYVPDSTADRHSSRKNHS